MATISQFKAHLQGGGARPNQFEVSMLFPTIAGSLGTYAGQTARFLCKSASLPSSIVEDVTSWYRGRPVHLAGERVFQPWTISIYNDTDFAVRNALEQWQQAILNYSATNGQTNPLIYQSQMIVDQLNRNQENVEMAQSLKRYEFFDVYPTNIGPIQLDFEANNQIEIFDVEFTYNYFVPSDIGGEPTIISA